MLLMPFAPRMVPAGHLAHALSEGGLVRRSRPSAPRANPRGSHLRAGRCGWSGRAANFVAVHIDTFVMGAIVAIKLSDLRKSTRASCLGLDELRSCERC